MKKLTVALIQQKCSADLQANRNNSIELIRKAVASGAELVAMQELHTALYFCQSENPEQFELAESIPGPSTDQFGAIAKELGIVLVLSLFERRAPGIYHNTAVVLEKNGSIAGKYRKMHIPDDPSYYEKFYFTPGDLGFEPIQTSVGKLGVLICWDQWYPEAARLMALAGAEILIYPTAIGWDPLDSRDEQERQLSAWQIIQRSHAVANGLPVLSINRIGLEDSLPDEKSRILFWGNSFVAGCQGELLAVAGNSEEEVLIATVEMSRCEKVRRIWPFLRDRRIDAYGGMTERYLD